MLNKCHLKFQIMLCIVLCSADKIANAQTGWNVEIRPSVNFPTEVSGAHGKNTGFGIEGKTWFGLTSNVGTYLGWGWNLFPAENRADFSYEETGFTLGMQYQHLRESQPGYFVAAGGVYNHIETEKREDHYNSDSGHKFGWQIESGVLFRISPKLLVKPSLRYRNLQAAGLQYFSIGTGFFFGR
jgi:hypothetical protein